MDISIVIPVFNEEENVKILHRDLHAVLKPMKLKYEIIFIDDGSTDSTFEVLSQLKGIKIIKFRKNFGQTAAMSAGFDHAEGKYIVSMDGDLQMDPHDIPLLYDKIRKDDLDVVCGWRAKRKDPFLKRIVSMFANKFRNLLIRDPVHDSGCTLRIYKKECFQELEMMGEMHRYIPALLRWKGFSIGEMKVRHYKRKYGKTKYNWKRIYKGFLDLFNVWFWRKFSTRPLHIFGGLGLFSLLISFLTGAYSIYLKIYRRLDLSDTFLPVVSVFLGIVGIQFFVSGLLADISIKNYYRKSHQYAIKKIIKK